MSSCKDLTAIDTEWSFCPSLPAAYIFCTTFGLTAVVHIIQAIIYRKTYSWVIIVSGLAQFICYVFRILSILNPTSLPYYAAWFTLILVAPLFTNAFVYMTMGRMVWNFVDGGKVWVVRASRIGGSFVVLDIVAFIVQVAGAATAVGQNRTESQVLHSLHIYMIGVGIQQLFIIIFLVFASGFHRAISS